MSSTTYGKLKPFYQIIDLILIFLILEATEVKKHFFLHMSQIQIFIYFSLFRRYKDEK